MLPVRMKLYASVTSERATKGQGGEYLEIDIYGTDRTSPKYYVRVTEGVIELLDHEERTLFSEGEYAYEKRNKERGEKQKGEHTHTWQYAGMCEGEESPRCGRKTYACQCGAYKDCDGGIMN